MEPIQLIRSDKVKTIIVRHLGEKGLGLAIRRAVAESTDGWPVAMICLKAGVGFSAELDILAQQDGWTLFDAWTRGEIADGKLTGYVSWKDRPITNAAEVEIPLAGIKSCHLSYWII
jgi:hypothetical protein